MLVTKAKEAPIPPEDREWGSRAVPGAPPSWVDFTAVETHHPPTLAAAVCTSSPAAWGISLVVLSTSLHSNTQSTGVSNPPFPCPPCSQRRRLWVLISSESPMVHPSPFLQYLLRSSGWGFNSGVERTISSNSVCWHSSRWPRHQQSPPMVGSQGGLSLHPHLPM